MSPWPCVIRPALPGGATPCTPTTIWPPGASSWIEPPPTLRTPDGPNIEMPPSRAAPSGNSAAMAWRPRRYEPGRGPCASLYSRPPARSSAKYTERRKAWRRASGRASKRASTSWSLPV
ncbi:hypothetical protein WJ970_24785 [Achromobacter xylosoxidans]